MPTQPLNTNSAMPPVGLGLWKIAPDTVADTVVAAIRAGYRHLDSACDYGNEREVGVGIRRALLSDLRSADTRAPRSATATTTTGVLCPCTTTRSSC